MIRIGVIGTGRAGMIHANNFASGAVPGASIVAIAEPVEQARVAAARELGVSADCVYDDYRKLLEQSTVDAVVVVTPTRFHREIVEAAASLGKHILCEKPMAISVSECDSMLKATQSAGVKLQIGFMRRFDVGFQNAKQRIDAGEIGKVVQVRSLTHGPSIPKPWMYDLTQSNGPLAEVNSHDIDALRWFTQSEFAEVYAIAGNYRSPDAVASYPDFYDNVLLSARMANGTQGAISGAQGVRYGYDSRCEILGEYGLITVGSLAGNTVVSYTPNGAEQAIVQSWRNLFLDAYRAEDADFIQCIVEDDEPRATGIDGRAAVMVVKAGNLSITERRPVVPESVSKQ